MKEENSNDYYEEDYYGQEQATTPSDQGVVNLANFIANATNLEELNIKRCMPKSKKIRQPTVAATAAITRENLIPLQILPKDIQ